MKTRLIFQLVYALLLFFITSNNAFSQGVAINDDGSNPDPSAMLDIKTTDKGLLIPRISLDDACTTSPVTSPAKGLIIYNQGGSEADGFYYWDGSSWIHLFDANNGDNDWTISGNDMYNNNSGNLGIGTTTPSEKLHVQGNMRLQGSFMPNNQAGNDGQILMSSGAGNNPEWGPKFGNTAAIEGVGKYYSGTFDIDNNTHKILTINDPNMRKESSVSTNFTGPLPSVTLYGYSLTLMAESRDGSVVFHIVNFSGYNFTNLEIVYTAFY